MRKRPFWINFLLIFLAPIVALALGVATTMLFRISQTNTSNLVINLFFLAACIGLISALNFSRADLGLQINRGHVQRHLLISLAVFGVYMLFYIFVIRISALKPFTSTIVWGLLTNLVVVLAEELYFRGLLYGFIEKRFSGKIALVVTALLFGLFHARQGVSGIVTKLFTGWLWGSVRYASGMIFLLIFPIHYAFNTIWLLFVGNWNNPPTWAIYALPVIEFTIGLAFVVIRDRQPGKVWK